ncbi:restriction endonuclease subunit S [Pseudomonas sp. CrR14]|nr:restriction endonuclease subunit S [Pseudomonas sp. CrR14]
MSADKSSKYKQSEEEVIQDEWNQGTLGQFISLRRGHDLTHRDRRKGTVPVMGSAGQNGFHNVALAYGPGVTLGRSGASYGQAHFCDVDYWPHNTALYVTDFKGSDALFIFYLLKSIDFSSHNTGGAQQSLNRNFIYPIQVALPNFIEQKNISSAISDMDALISSLNQLIAKKRDIQQAAMQQLLTGQHRLPGFTEKWDIKPMRALGNTYGGLAGKTKIDFGHGEARYIPFMNVMTDTVIDASWLEAVDIAPNEAQNLAKKGDLFFNGSSETPDEVGFCSVLLEEIPNLYLNSFCFGFRFNTAAKANGLFFAYWFRSKAGRSAMSVLAQGATRYNIAKSAFMQLEIPQPSEEEQTAIATILSDMDTELTALETRRDKALQLKQGMMQELLTGRTRLV